MEFFNINAELVIDYIGLLVATVALIMIYDLKTALKATVGSALNYIMIGILFHIGALIWTIIFIRLNLFPEPVIDLHHFLTTFGIVSFVFAARKFSSLEQQNNG